MGVNQVWELGPFSARDLRVGVKPLLVEARGSLTVSMSFGEGSLGATPPLCSLRSLCPEYWEGACTES